MIGLTSASPGKIEMQRLDISRFRYEEDLFEGAELALVVKSQNQLERRQNMIGYLAAGKIGRSKQRGVAAGLLVHGKVTHGIFQVNWTRDYREPRHIVPFRGGYLMTTIDRVVVLDGDFRETQQISHPGFSGMHALSVSRDQCRFLVTSSGFDRIFEFTLEDGIFRESWVWKGWEHGFNPNDEGLWLTDDAIVRQRWEKEGKKVGFIDKLDYGAEGLPIARRTMHTNSAVYDCYDEERSVILTCASEGNLYRIDKRTKSAALVCNGLHTMPHGVLPFRNGWAVVDTTVGEWLQMNRRFEVEKSYSLRTVPGKPDIAAEYEWVQNYTPYQTGLFLVDANRGLFALDLEREVYAIYAPDENWCIQDILPVYGSGEREIPLPGVAASPL